VKCCKRKQLVSFGAAANRKGEKQKGSLRQAQSTETENKTGEKVRPIDKQRASFPVAKNRQSSVNNNNVISFWRVIKVSP